jgi:predicted nucleic acid-binding protein
MKAVLDACVIYPTVLREILVGVAARGLYEPLWSERILREWVLATAKLGLVVQAQAEAEALTMRAAFPRAMVRERPEIEARLLLPDAGDHHVLAVAIAAHADCIVTFNAKDFPRHVLAEEGIARREPDSLLWELWSHHPEAVAQVVIAVHATAEAMAGGQLPLKALMKRAQLPKLGRAMLAQG